LKKNNTRTPLKDNPLRNPGQSLDEQIRDLIQEKLIMHLIAIGFAFSIMMAEWIRYFRPHPPKPLLGTIIFIVVALFCGIKFYLGLKKIKKLRLGRDGEKAVGQFLERFRADGAQVYHDITSDTFNIDHVIVSSHGIFLIETKTYSKPIKGKAVIDYDGDQIQFNNGFKDQKILLQAKAGAKWIRDLIRESTGKDFLVQPVVVFPGWYVESKQPPFTYDVWVLNPRALPAFIKNGRHALSDEDIHLVSYHLSRYIRTFKKPEK
jgi:hypothetical protein